MIRFGQGQNDERKKMKYEVVVSASIRTVWEADSKEQALRQAEAWTAEEYGDLVHKANFDAREIS
jgi:uncharacterized protein YndB with AHSA1/START domain